MDLEPRSRLSASGTKTAFVYVVMLAVTVGAFLGIRGYGRDLAAPPGTGFGTGTTGHIETLLHVLLALVVVIIASRALGALLKYLHQPPVIGEVIAGIVLGPSLLGRVAPGVSAYVLPPSVAPFLGILAQVGVLLFMFLVGLELDTGLLRRKTQATLAIAHASITTPFLLGSVLALFLYPKLSTSDVPFGTFTLFMGVSMSVTAFPVLARILSDRGIQKTRMGVIAISCAAINDVTAWCLLAFVVAVAQAKLGSALITIGLALAYLALMIGVVRPIVRRIIFRQELTHRLSQNATAVVLVGLLLSALITEYIGIHALFGAFLVGALIPHESMIAKDMANKLEDLVVVFFLPAFFAFTGMRTQIGLVQGPTQWLICGAIVLVACLGKFGGSAVAARLSGLSWRDSACLGVLMNTRGLMELIVLNIGLDLKVISPPLFAMLVIMALVTTFATTPALQLLTNKRPLEEPELSAASTE